MGSLPRTTFTAWPKNEDTFHTETVTNDSKDTAYTATVRTPMRIYAIDFGTGDALVVYGPAGIVSKKLLNLPRVKGGRTAAMEFTMVVDALMRGNAEVPPGDVVVESATIGSSGCETADVIALLEVHPDRALYTLSTRAVKNFRADNPDKYPWKKGARYADSDAILTPEQLAIYKQVEVHEEDALILYMIATETPTRLYHWTGPSTAAGRVHTSVRPMDKRGYRDERSLQYLKMLPPFETLPAELQEVLGAKGSYSGSMVMPFAMASTEPHIDDGPREDRRRRYEKVIGLYDRGYPSFYRRATIVWMQKNAKTLADVTKIEDVPPSVRKEAWKLTQRQVRHFFHLTMAHQGR